MATMQQKQQFNPFAGLQKAFHENPIVQGFQAGIAGFQKQQQQPKQLVMKRDKAPKRVTLPRHAPFAAIIPGDSIGEAVIATGLLNFLNLYNSALVVRLVLTWFPNPPEFIVQPLATVTDPYLGLFRGIIPPIGGTLDLSPILAFVVLNFFTNTAAALPCEVAPDGRPLRKAPEPASNPFSFLQPSKFQQLWAKRVDAAKSSDVPAA
eukprot:CAMPEP_0202865898 /NCGR_PEP_ID=MMETSP1391-20130828/6651_1 /ASSEMBLY_ACC=CAM_ASM_000867 /TAXON_ID=1034604 /ORGANISM="Chlamydomonas leiostraca, Strain SAG 11-49" /LENGTH=206 /DNA_ID=CAMNT_0049545789 /DNA_START=9 /DNA_END=629 /DNA_ORIENTATION=+